MDLIDKLNELAARAIKQREHLQTEEATKTSLVLPFIQALGYDVFNPLEVVPEFTADVGIKKGEKVDYAIMRNESPTIIFECKWCGTDLDDSHASQLHRYFNTTPARFAVLTNGIVYRFFSDLDSPNQMDKRPFLEINMADLRPASVQELKRFSKETFDLDDILSTASDLKYTKGIKRVLDAEWGSPSEELTKLLANRVYDGRLTRSVVEQFAGIVRKALREFINDRLNERLKSALSRESAATGSDTPAEVPSGEAKTRSGIVTTDDETEGFHIVRAIASSVVRPERVVMRDTKSYCGVLLDDNNRKPVCRLLFNGSQLHLGLFDAKKEMTRVPIDGPAGIYEHAEHLRQTIKGYEKA